MGAASNCACDFYELSQSNLVNNLFSAKKRGKIARKRKKVREIAKFFQPR